MGEISLLRGLLLVTSPTPMSSAVVGLRLVAYTLVYAVVNSRIDYCNAVLAGAPRTVTDKLQRALNAIATYGIMTLLLATGCRECMNSAVAAAASTACRRHHHH